MAGNPPQSKGAASRRDSNEERGRACLRGADSFIKQQKYSEARTLLEEAKRLDAANPYIAALDERLRQLEAAPKAKPATDSPSPPSSPVSASLKEHQLPTDIPATPEMIERRLRQEIEAEFRSRYMTEIQDAETNAAKALDEERVKLEQQRVALTAQHENQVQEMRNRIEQEYEQRLAKELAGAEEKLTRQSEAELTTVERDMKARIAKEHETETQQIRVRVEQEKMALLEKERKSFLDRERLIRDEFDRRMAEVLGRREIVQNERVRQQKLIQQERQRKKMEAEFQKQLFEERAKFQKQMDALKASLEESATTDLHRLKEEQQRQLDDELESIRKREASEFERKRIKLLRDIEAQLQSNYYSQIAAERKRMKEESETAIETEKLRLQTKYDDFVAKQTKKIKNLRVELRADLEKEYIRRLEQVWKQYEKKMELLGIRMPQNKDDAKALYRDRMRSFYENGQPTLEQAKQLIELKELLGLDFDEHFQMESDIRLELYVENIEKKIISGALNVQEEGKLSELKQQFRISAEEAQRLEPYILSSYQRFALKGRLLVVDDDAAILKTVGDELSDRGFQVVTCDTVESALEALKTTAFDLILSDIKFDNSNLDGFKFFSSVQEQPHLRSIPFILMSSLHDGVIIRSGVQLGIDDYLVKPVDNDLLVAVIEGKLKRYRSFGRN